MKVNFFKPFINHDVEEQVLATLNSGWITTGDKVRILEDKIKNIYGFNQCIGVNSWTSGAILILNWFGISEGDEVIIPSYTYAATALSVIHAGAKPILVDINEDFNIDPLEVKKKINSHTKAIIGVDIAGKKALYSELNKIINQPEINAKFVPRGNIQKLLGRILLISDSAHSLGSKYKASSDISIYSLHAAKNFTSAEGGIIGINLNDKFNNYDLYEKIKRLTINGQTKDAQAKQKSNSWRYDINEFGFKFNLPDINAAITLGQLKSFDYIVTRRRIIYQKYQNYFASFDWAQLPYNDDIDLNQSSFHLYMLRVLGISEDKRDKIISEIFKIGIELNVHYIPLPLLTAFKKLDYNISDYPRAYDNYSREITLPLYPQLKDEEVQFICESVSSVINTLL